MRLHKEDRVNEKGKMDGEATRDRERVLTGWCGA